MTIPMLFAALAVTTAARAIDLTPIVAELAPFAVAAVGALASWALHKIAVKFHLDALDTHRAVLIEAVENGVAFALKRVPPTAPADARVTAAVNYVLPKVPDALRALKVTPDSLAEIIAARLPA